MMEDEDVGEESVVLINGSKKQFMIDNNFHSAQDIIKIKQTTKLKIIIMKRLQRGNNILKRTSIFLAFLMLISNYSAASTTSATNSNQLQQPRSNTQASSASSPLHQSTSSSSSSSSSPSSSPPQDISHHSSQLEQISPGINLIPVDQPVTSERSNKAQVASSSSSNSGDDTSRIISLSEPISDNNNLQYHNNFAIHQHDISSASNLDAPESSSPVESIVGVTTRNIFGGSDNVADFIEENHTPAYNVESATGLQVNSDKKHQQQVESYIQQAAAAVYHIPDHQLFFNKHQYTTKQPTQQQQLVERRFGLLKKHYGTPMTANYATSGHYMSDCERCLFSLGAGQQQSADLQQIDPPPTQPIVPILPPMPQPAPLPPPPPPTIIPAPQPTVPQNNNFGLKNKFLMKFPFLMKPISFGSSEINNGPSYNMGSFTEAVPYWYPSNQQHYQQQPVRQNAALYLRPAYNCIQATPSLISSGPNQHISDVTTYSGHNNNNHHSGSSSGALSATKGGQSKQSFPFQQQQQTSY